MGGTTLMCDGLGPTIYRDDVRHFLVQLSNTPYHDIREKRINQWLANLSAANCDEKLSIPRHKDDWWWFASVSRASLFTKLEFTFEFVVDNALKSILNHNSYLITRMAGNKIIKHIVSQIAMLGIIRDSSLFASPITSCNTQNSCANELLW